jgi:hypothetical protein
MQTEKLISDIENKDAQTQKTIIETQQATIDSYKAYIDAMKNQREAGIPLTADDHDVRIKQQDLIIESQQAVDPGPNREQAADIVNQAVAQEQALEDAAVRRLTVEQPSTAAGQTIQQPGSN